MTSGSLDRLRQRATALRDESRRATERRARHGGRAADDLTTLSVDAGGQLVAVSYTSEVINADPGRWAASLLNVYRAACRAIPPVIPTAAQESRRHVPSGPAMPGKPLAPEQHETRARTERMVERAAAFAARQGGLEFTGTAQDLWLTFDGGGRLLEARATSSAVAAGPGSLAQRTAEAWADAQRQFSTSFGAEGS